LLNRFNKPKKIIQRGGAKTADEIKMDFLREVRSLIKGKGGKNGGDEYECDSSNITFFANQVFNSEKYTFLNGNGYEFKYKSIPSGFIKWFCKTDMSGDPPGPLGLFYKGNDEIKDEELVDLFSKATTATNGATTDTATVPETGSTATPANDATQIYMEFRQKIKDALAGQPCNEDTIQKVGQQILDTDPKYKTLKEHYYFNTDTFASHDGQMFLSWFCGNSSERPGLGFPRMFIPRKPRGVMPMNDDILLQLMNGKAAAATGNPVTTI
jgi:hypothetical protein